MNSSTSQVDAEAAARIRAAQARAAKFSRPEPTAIARAVTALGRRVAALEQRERERDAEAEPEAVCRPRRQGSRG